ncbi:hypothetical protein, partial [Sphingomonas sp. SAFR-052]|uniref:hypothetical protein n=1 Tax=Sphingomonas sp. SAFR-052 TaxID=3436867 RepID=UPI003F7F28DA
VNRRCFVIEFAFHFKGTLHLAEASPLCSVGTVRDVVFDNGVEGYDELVHGGDDRELEGLSGVAQGFAVAARRPLPMRTTASGAR